MSHSPHAVLATLLATTLFSAPVFAQEANTLKKIKDSGSITLAHRDSSIPFSYLANETKPIGFAMDIADAIVEEVKKELGMSTIKVSYNLVTSQTRIPLIQNGTADLECGSTTNNVERQQQVAFTNGFFKVATRLLTKKTSGVKDFADLAGKNVVTTAGTTSERLLKKLNEEKKLGMNIITAKDHGESFLMLESSRAVAFMMDDVLLAGEMAKAKKPDDWAIVGTPQSYEIYGCMVRKGDAAFKAVADRALTNFYKSGRVTASYGKWFQQAIPPKGLNMNFAMSDGLKELFTKPTDKSAEEM